MVVQALLRAASSAVEYKAEQLATTEDTREKEAIGELREARSEGACVPFGDEGKLRTCGTRGSEVIGCRLRLARALWRLVGLRYSANTMPLACRWL